MKLSEVNGALLVRVLNDSEPVTDVNAGASTSNTVTAQAKHMKTQSSKNEATHQKQNLEDIANLQDDAGDDRELSTSEEEFTDDLLLYSDALILEEKARDLLKLRKYQEQKGWVRHGIKPFLRLPHSMASNMKEEAKKVTKMHYGTTRVNIVYNDHKLKEDITPKESD